MKQRSDRPYQRVSLGDVALVIATRLRVVVWSEKLLVFLENYLPERRYYLVLVTESLVDYRTYSYIFLEKLYSQYFLTIFGDYVRSVFSFFVRFDWFGSYDIRYIYIDRTDSQSIDRFVIRDDDSIQTMEPT